MPLAGMDTTQSVKEAVFGSSRCVAVQTASQMQRIGISSTTWKDRKAPLSYRYGIFTSLAQLIIIRNQPA